MSNKPTYKEVLINYFENKKIVAWVMLLLIGIVFAGQVASSLESLGLNNNNNNKEYKRCDQIDQSIAEINREIKEVIRLSNNSINLLKIKYSISQHKNLIVEAEDKNCFTGNWKEQKLNMLKTTILSEVYLFIKDGEENLANPLIEKDLSLLCKDILEHFNSYKENILSEKEKDALLKTIKITQDEN